MKWSTIQQGFAYEVADSKKSMISVKMYEGFNVKSFTESEITATVYGSVKHGFTRGQCESSFARNGVVRLFA